MYYFNVQKPSETELEFHIVDLIFGDCKIGIILKTTVLD